MADVVFPYTPADGAALDPGELNKDLYDTTPSVSLYETANGRVELGNFAAGFRVKPFHVRPREAGDASATGMLNSVDYFQDAWGKSSKFYPVAGLTYTWYQRNNATVALLCASAFATVWRNPGPWAGGVFVAAPNIVLHAFLDDENTNINHAIREMPQSVQYSAGPPPNITVHTLEARVTRHYNLICSKLAGGAAPFTQLTSGWHTFGLKLYINPNYDGRNTGDPNQRKDLALNGAAADARPTAFYNALHRARFFVRNIAVVTVL